MLVEITVIVPVYVPGTKPFASAEITRSPNADALVDPFGVAFSQARFEDVRHVIGMVLIFRTGTGELVAMP